jgi:transcriptional regulator GlxA family with amidase domain
VPAGRHTRTIGSSGTHISIVATPEAMVSPVSGLFEILTSVGSLVAPEDGVKLGREPFDVDIVGETAGPIESAAGLSVIAHRSIAEVAKTDVVIVSPMAFATDSIWTPGRHPRLVAWIREMHASGATVCSACTGGMLTAETGLLDGHEATVHWVADATFRARHPGVRLRPHEALVVSGKGGRLVSSGAATAWHDLILYLVARHVGPATAQAVARFHLLQWHRDGQAPFNVFDPPTDHGEAAILDAQRWVAEHYAVAGPVAEMQQLSGLAPRTFKRRFKAATGLTPIRYVQHIRVERAKRLLETTAEPTEEISWAVGYEDPAAFRRLFKRLAGLTPAEYRRRFHLPDLPYLSTRAR